MENSNLHLTEQIKSHLNQTAKWGRFLAILGFVGIGLLVLIAVFIGSFMETLNSLNSVSPADNTMPADFGNIMSVFFIVLAIIYFFPTLYLYNFSSKMLSALNTDDNEYLEASFSNLKSFYKFIGILYIVIIFINFLAFIGAFAYTIVSPTVS